MEKNGEEGKGKSGFPQVNFEEMKSFFEACTEFNTKLMNAGMNISKDGIDQDTYKMFFAAWQESLADSLDKYLHSPGFCEKMGQNLSTSMLFKKNMDQMMLSSLKSLKLPTRDDINELYVRIDTIEEKLDQVLERLDKR